MATPVNATGWTELMDGNMVSAAYTVFDTAFGGIGLFAFLLFILYEFMLYHKTQNTTAMLITGIMFAGLYASSQIFEPVGFWLMFVLLSLEIASIFYMAIMNTK